MAEPSKSAPAAGTAAAADPSAPDPLIGRVINQRFHILSVIARGGMGKVYKAEQAPLGRICAVKVLTPNYAGDNDPEFHKRFFLEASIASKLTHPNTVTIFDYGATEDNVYFMAMEFLEGRTLHRVIREEGPFAPERAVRIAIQVCRSLREAHGLGVIHRDLKPANVFLVRNDDDQDFVKVLDFGLVKNVDEAAESLTQTGLFMGSPKYMAPEQIRGERVTPAADIYALGVVLYEMLTGKVPFDRGNSMNTLMAHVQSPVPPMSETAPQIVVPELLEALVYKCLEKMAEDRFGSMEELIQALKGIAGEPVRATAEFGAARNSMVAGDSGGRSFRAITGDALPAASSGPVTVSGPSAHVPSATPPPLPGPSGPVVSITPLGSQAPPASRMPQVLIGVGLLAFAIGGTYLLMSMRHGATNATAATSATPIAAPTPPHVHVSLQSDPPHAEVLEGQTSLGHTPLALDWVGDQGDPSRPHTFTFRLDTYQTAVATLSGASIAYTAHLLPTPPPPAPIAQPTPTPAPAHPTSHARPRPHPAGNATHGTPAGYRDVDW